MSEASALLHLDAETRGWLARVLVDDAPDRLFDYAVSDALRGRMEVGSRVRVPFGRQERLGTVLEVVGGELVGGIKTVQAVCDELPAFTEKLVALGEWIADYYCCRLPTVLRGMLPQVVRRGESGFLERQMVVKTAALTDEIFRLTTHRAPRQASILERLMAAEGPMTASELLREAGAGRDALRQLVAKGLVRVEMGRVLRDRHRHEEEVVAGDALELNEEQRSALGVVLEALASVGAGEVPRPILLHGVTGSGKTEIYLQGIQAALDRGYSALVLVPEIALTPQTVERFQSRFQRGPYGIAVLHSRLSEGERHDEWHRIRAGEARIVIGARSAVFAPLRQPGLIVVDEEHETSYKQEEMPKYHARDVAVVRARLEGCAILLGSATPALESMHNVMRGKYRCVRLTKRIDDQVMPLIRVIDMRSERGRVKGGEAIVSLKLRNAITGRLEKREQVLLFLNRRGFSTSLLCNACGYVAQCENCSVSMTFHRADERLVCHLCGHTIKAPRKCPSCGDPKIRFPGVGTERVEGAVEKLFPGAKVGRMDADTMTRRDAVRETLLAFRQGKIDILIGTQMIAKGLHFPNVTLVGIINADTSLHLPDFRAGERTFQLLVQVAGRAGRGDLAGEVMIQSATPFAPAIQYARHHDYDGFLEQELEFRRVCGHPPFTHVMLVQVRSTHEELGWLTAETVHRRLVAGLESGVVIGEPAPAPIERLKRNYRYQILLREPRMMGLSRRVREIVAGLPLPENVFVGVDVDPYQLL